MTFCNDNFPAEEHRLNSKADTLTEECAEHCNYSSSENTEQVTESRQPEDIIAGDFRMLFKPSLRKTIRKIRIDLEGNLSIARMNEINRGFIQVLSRYDYFDFEINKVSAIDLAAVQLLHRLKTCYISQNKYITVHISMDAGFRTLLNNAGLSGIC